MSNASDNGFSLAEVIAALGVFSVAALGLIELSGETTRNASHLSWRALAEIEANNQMAEVLVSLNAPAGLSSGETTLRNRTLVWTRSITGTDTPGVQMIEITVARPDTEQVIVRQNALKGITP